MQPIKIISQLDLDLVVLPAIFIDKYMPTASGDFVKVYLYLLRWSEHPDADLTVPTIAMLLDMTESDVTRALRYWENQFLLKIQWSKDHFPTEIALCPIKDHPVASSAFSSEKASTQPLSSASSPVLSTTSVESIEPIKPNFTKPSFSMADIADFSKNKGGDTLLFAIQHLIGRPLNQTDLNTIVYFHETLGFSNELIEYLFEYCVASNHKGLHYIESVAINWAEEGIDTVTKAKQRPKAYSKLYYDVLKAFGIRGRAPGVHEAAFIEKWSDDMGFSDTLIIEACNRTLAQIHQPEFKYADRILQGWFKKKAFSLDAVQQLDVVYEKNKSKAGAETTNTTSQQNKTTTYKPTKNHFTNFEQRNYDGNNVEQMLLQKVLSQKPN